MRIALALPPKHPLAQDQFVRRPQLGIGYVAAGLKKAGLDLTVFNSKHQNIYEKELATRLLQEPFDIVGFSAMTFEIKSVGRIAERLKAARKDCLIAVGGCHVNALPKETMEEFPHFDIAFIGEHEDHVSEVFDALYRRDYTALEGFDHIVFRRDDELCCRNLNRRIIKDLDSLPWPAYELFGSRDLDPAYVTSRGCPSRCRFCQQNSGRVVRTRDAGDVCDELEHFSAYFNQSRFSFRDESFTVNKKHTVAVCNELIKRGLNKKLEWICETHSRVADYELFCLMKEAGCHYVDIGIESGADEILRATGKSTTVEVIKNACDLVRKAKLGLGGLFILGHPNETKRTMLKTIALGVKLNPDSITFSMMTPFPGTKVFELASKGEAGLKLRTRDWERYDNITGSAMAWDNFSVTTLKILQAVGIVTYYLYNLRLRQFSKYIRKHRKGILAYFASLFTQAFRRGPGRAPNVTHQARPESLVQLGAGERITLETKDSLGSDGAG